MKYLKILGLAAVAAMAMAAVAVSSASATTLEVGGVTKNETVTITASLESGTSALLALTGGGFANTCTASHAHGYTTSPFTGTKVTGTFTGHTAHDKSTGQLPTDGLSFAGCDRPVTVNDPGTLYVEHITGTTDGTVFSENANVTVHSPIGALACTTPAAGTFVGTLTGKAAGQATLDVKAVLNCGFLAPSANWTGSYVVTSPEGLGVSA